MKTVAIALSLTALTLTANARPISGSTCRTTVYLANVKSGASSATIASDSVENLNTEILRFCSRSNGCQSISQVITKTIPGTRDSNGTCLPASGPSFFQ